MGKGRMEAFSDGVLAIIITIMVLELRPPGETSIEALKPLWPIFVSYILSFIYVGIYWNNHHHMLTTVKHVNGSILWANLHLLFWLSLVPFTTAWNGAHQFAAIPMAIYGVNLLMAAIAYWILQYTIVRSDGDHSFLKRAIGRDYKGKASPLLYLTAIFLSFVSPWFGAAIYVLVALMWLIPDRRIERAVEHPGEVA
jgi:uncharacterized membrane protein